MTALDRLPDALRGKLVVPGDSRYPTLRSTYTKTFSPAAVLLPASTAEVVAALRYAREQAGPISVRSGGHGLHGHSSNNGGVVIDLSALNRVEVLDRRTRLVRVGPGARWARVAQALAPHGLAISSGDHGNVGVGGIATGGGVGWLVRQYGLTIDHVRAVEVVLADGTVVRADAEHEPDLFWAVRGAGGGVGIVTAFEIEAMELDRIGVAQVVVEAGRDGLALRQWADYLAEAPRELSTAVSLLPYGRGTALSIVAVVASGHPRRLREAVRPLTEIGTGLLDQSSQVVPYPALVSTAHLHANVGQQPAETTNGLLAGMSHEDAAALVATASGPDRALVQLRSVGGAVNDVPAEATAYPHRHQRTLVVASTFPPRAGAGLDRAWRRLADRVDGAYVNFESRPSRASFDRSYPGATGRRVTDLWRRYDPDAVFRPPHLR
ncbi:FAD-dependent oxidoreductase [Plantactinospora sp. B24E8]|uniref:FAD-binding oxidoreductase n=1 Tax=Plantactinospora sp. B24E8 TaxID=3153567 RepID=UPI00325E3E8A